MADAALQGRLADFTLEEILQLIALQQKTGLLIVDASYPMLLAFDTGPCNMLLDGLIGLNSRGRRRMDEGGKLAIRGRVNENFLRWLLDHPYLSRRPPKSTGREMFGTDYVRQVWKQGRSRKLSLADVLATACRFVAQSVRDAQRWIPDTIDEVVVGGGGVHNARLWMELENTAAPASLKTMETLGSHSSAFEALAFAILAYQRIKHVSAGYRSTASCGFGFCDARSVDDIPLRGGGVFQEGDGIYGNGNAVTEFFTGLHGWSVAFLALLVVGVGFLLSWIWRRPLSSETPGKEMADTEDTTVSPRAVFSPDEATLFNLVRLAVQEEFLVLAKLPLLQVVSFQDKDEEARKSVMRMIQQVRFDILLVHPGTRQTQIVIRVQKGKEETSSIDDRERLVGTVLKAANIRLVVLYLEQTYSVEQLVKLLGLADEET